VRHISISKLDNYFSADLPKKTLEISREFKDKTVEPILKVLIGYITCSVNNILIASL